MSDQGQRGRRRPRAAAPARHGSEGRSRARSAWLTPVLLDYASRDGSTFTMRLLRTSPQVAMDSAYPYEHKYFAYLTRWSQLLDREDWPEDSWSPGELGSLTQAARGPLIGPPPWYPRPAFKPASGRRSMSERAFTLVWREFSRRAAAAAAAERDGRPEDAVLYVEKHLNTWQVDLDELPDLKVIVLLRDPRDVYVSIKSVNAKRAGRAPLIGIAPGEDESRWRERYLRHQRDRLRWIASLGESGGDGWPVLRYEDLILDFEGQARRLERLLSIKLDPEEAAGDEKLRATHASSATPEASLGRWKRELPAPETREFAEALGDELKALGFEV